MVHFEYKNRLTRVTFRQIHLTTRPGLAPAGDSLVFCFAKEKYPKERRPCCLRPFAALRAPCGARSSRGLARTRLRLRQSRALIRLDFRSSAHTEGVGGNKYQQPNSAERALRVLLPDSDFFCPKPVLAGLSSTGADG